MGGDKFIERTRRYTSSTQTEPKAKLEAKLVCHTVSVAVVDQPFGHLLPQFSSL